MSGFAEGAVLLGIDIGGTKIAGGLVEAATGRILHADRVPTNAAEGGAAVLERALKLAKHLCANSTPAAIGIGAGGQIDSASGVVLSATEILPVWAGTPLKGAFADAFGLPVYVDNDVNALAAGENRFGAGRGFSNLVYLALGTGVGGAIISNGRLHRSKRGVSGELGHLILNPDGLPCTCGGHGCLEQYASGPALLRLYHALGGEPLSDGVSLAQQARQNPDGPAARAIAQVGDALGVALVSLVNIFGPEQVIIGGGLAALGDLLLVPARRVVALRALLAVRDVPIVTAALGGEASVIGAASLALLAE